MPYIGNEPTSGAFELMDSLTATTTATYALTKDSVAYYPASPQNLIVSVNNVTKTPVTDYTVSGSNIVFSGALSGSDTINYILALGHVRDINVPGDSTVSTSKIADDAVTPAKIDFQLGPRNLLINGGMDCWQRSTSVTGKTTSGYYTADRWGVDIASHGTYTIARSTDVPANSGFSYSTKIDCTVADTSLASNAQVDLYQVIEAQNLLRIKGGQSTPDPLILSFWVKSNLTGTATVELIASDASLQLSKTFTIDSANTWEKKELTYAGLTGAVTPDNGVGMYVIIWLAAGSNFTSGTLNSSTWASVGNTTNRVSSSNINIASSTSDEILFTGLQLEQGSATDFEFESYATTLEKCKRYYHKMQAESPYDRFVMGFCVTADDSRHPVNFYPQMRSVPTLETGGTFAVLTSSEVGQGVSSIAIDTNTDSSQRATLQVAASAATLSAGDGTALAALNDATTYIAFNAEL